VASDATSAFDKFFRAKPNDGSTVENVCRNVGALTALPAPLNDVTPLQVSVFSFLPITARGTFNGARLHAESSRELRQVIGFHTRPSAIATTHA
jgi:hypothetical protein